jgi:hypothetical protein
MPKVNVTANEDFFDRANQVQRRKGDVFILRGDYAETLGKQVKIGDAIVVADNSSKKEHSKAPVAKNERALKGIDKVKDAKGAKETKDKK